MQQRRYESPLEPAPRATVAWSSTVRVLPRVRIEQLLRSLRIEQLLSRLRMEALLCEERIETTDIQEPMDPTERTAPMDPTEANDPMLPTERTEPSEPMDRNELRERQESMVSTSVSATARGASVDWWRRCVASILCTDGFLRPPVAELARA
jgi:hypothetical protein